MRPALVSKPIPEHLLLGIAVVFPQFNPDACMLWPGRVNPQGYGIITGKGVRALSHRAMYALVYGQLENGYCVLHSCDTPACCNPWHLRPGTRTENVAERDAKRRQQFGSRHYSTWIDEATVRQLRDLHFINRVPVEELARRYGYMTQSMWKIIHRRTWKHVE